MPRDVLELLGALKDRFPHKFIWIELGLQTIHENTARLIRRGYELPCFEEAFWALFRLSVPVIVHVILGLPGESRKHMLETIAYLNRINPFGVKLQLLHVLKGTDLAKYYAEGRFAVLEKDAYLELVADCLEHLSPRIVIHRLTGDGPKNLLIAPLWSGNKRDVLNRLHRYLKERGTVQGCRYQNDKVSH